MKSLILIICKVLPFAVALSIVTPAQAQTQELEVQSEDVLEEQPMMHRKEMRKNIRKHMRTKVKKHIKQMDTNGDGKVDLTEYLTHAEQRFNDMDLDGDNYVTGEEARKHHKQVRKEHVEARKKHRKERKKHREEAERDHSEHEITE